MLWLKFNGWFQCRLATDPDPSDEPRGVSGYVRALVGEPDLDRILRLQPHGTVHRSHTPDVGVRVRAIFDDGRRVNKHPLLDATVDLLNEPKFEGRNWIVAEDGTEPIVPFHLQVSRDDLVVSRPHAQAEDFPFTELRAQGLVFCPGEIGDATGIFDLRAAWQQRAAQLQDDLQHTNDPVHIAALKRRIAMLRAGRLTMFYPAKMPYNIALSGKAVVNDPRGLLKRPIDTTSPWSVDCWFGGWDPDALCGFAQGYIGLPYASPAAEAARAAELSVPLAHPELRRA